ncbi:DUF4190 domain-containing protein [Streptomyces sp. NPDC001985]|uniref:DUF4190 domain-containing protein n=1 Tax=Streptomyces sp. NPDC001985 TaxID=3154406 RepID=UPI0033348DE3
MSSSTGTHGRSQAQGLAIASLVCGILGLFLYSLILGPVAILIGYLALRHATGNGRALAKAGVWLGIADLTIFAILLMAAS